MKLERSGADEQIEDRISAEIASIHEDSYGTVPAVRTYLLDNGVLCVVEIDLLPHELTLLAGGRGADSIRSIRTDFQCSIQSTSIAAVEHSTGRQVTAFVSDTHLDPPFSLEFFRLAG